MQALTQYSQSKVGRKSYGGDSKATRMCRTSQNGGCTTSMENSEVRMSRHLDASTTTLNGRNLGPVWKTLSFLLNEIYLWSSTCRTIMGKAIRQKFIRSRMGKSSKLGMLVCKATKGIVLVSVRGRHKIGWKEAEHRSLVEGTNETRRLRRTNIMS